MTKPTATQRKVKAAFREVHENTPKIVRHTAQKYGAKRAEAQRTAIALSKARKAGARVPDASGANYVSDNALHVPVGASSGVSHAGERVPYRENVSPTCDVVAPVKESDHGVEYARRENNQARDARTNLGRGKPAHVEVD